MPVLLTTVTLIAASLVAGYPLDVIVARRYVGHSI